MFDATKKELKKKFDVVIMAAAASDYTPENSQNQKSKVQKIQLQLGSKSTKNH